MTSDYKKTTEIALIDLLYAQAEISQAQVFTPQVMRALKHIESAIALLQSTEALERGNTERIEAA